MEILQNGGATPLPSPTERTIALPSGRELTIKHAPTADDVIAADQVLAPNDKMNLHAMACAVAWRVCKLDGQEMIYEDWRATLTWGDLFALEGELLTGGARPSVPSSPALSISDSKSAS